MVPHYYVSDENSRVFVVQTENFIGSFLKLFCYVSRDSKKWIDFKITTVYKSSIKTKSERFAVCI